MQATISLWWVFPQISPLISQLYYKYDLGAILFRLSTCDIEQLNRQGRGTFCQHWGFLTASPITLRPSSPPRIGKVIDLENRFWLYITDGVKFTKYISLYFIVKNDLN